MAIQIHNPYRNESLPWHKGNLHTHSSRSDGDRDPQTVIDQYAALGHSFLMLSDHDVLTDVAGLDPRGMVVIPGNEITDHGPHILHVDARSPLEPRPNRQRVLDAVARGGGFSIICHPNWEKNFNHCPQNDLERWRGYLGIEVYNGVVAFLEGSPFATDRWDMLLSRGRRIWGYANDDSHWAPNVGLAWNVVQCDELRADSILEALREGQFYASTGVTIDRIEVSDHTICVRAPDAQRIVAYADHQRRVAVADGQEIALHVDDACASAPGARMSYVRFECWGSGESIAWTQPFFLERS